MDTETVVYIYFKNTLQTELTQSKNIRMVIEVIIPSSLITFRQYIDKVLCSSGIIGLGIILGKNNPVSVTQFLSCGPDESSFMEDVSEANPKQAFASWICCVQEHLNCFLVVIVNDGCQAPTKIFTVLDI